jgi:hypothetical protein
MRLQNIIAACIFVGLLVCYAAMQLLNLYPSSAALWAFNITIAREIRPIFELFDVLLAENSRVIPAAFAAMSGLCWLAWHQRSTIITTLTTHAALFCVLYANIASHGPTVQAKVSASTGILPAYELVSDALSSVDLAMVAIALALLVNCLANHFCIIREMLTAAPVRRASASTEA